MFSVPRPETCEELKVMEGLMMLYEYERQLYNVQTAQL